MIRFNSNMIIIHKKGAGSLSIQMILGSSGSGKSYYLYNHIINESKKNQDINFLVIVPEQFTMQTQKDFVIMSKEKGIMNIDVLSFLRLAYRVFDETPGYERAILEDVGKSMVLRKVLHQTKDQLKYFGKNCDKPGFIDEVKSMLSELLQYNMDETDLDEMIKAAENRPMLNGKLGDLQIVFREFRKYLKNEYITAEEIFTVLIDAAGESKLIRNSVICLDGFTGFTPSQYELLAELMRVAKKIYITVTIDPREDLLRRGEKFLLFYLSRKTIRRCYEIARESGIEIEKNYIAGKGREKKPYRTLGSAALETLERNLFRYPRLSFEGEQEDITIHSLKDPEEEVRFVLVEIQNLVREHHYRYRDIAIVTGDIENYGRMADREMGRVGIPCFVDHKKDVLSNAAVEMLLSLVEVLRKDFDYESLFRFLRCGFTDFTREDIDRMENYVLAYGIRGHKRWNKEWKKPYPRGEGKTERINECRKMVMQWMEPIKVSFSGGSHSVKEYTTAIYEFMQEMNLYEKIERKREAFVKSKETLMAKEYDQIYHIVLELFDHFVTLLGEEKVTLKEYEELLKTGLREAKVGLIPPGVDQVVVGDMERTRLKDIKALFFLGVNDGIVPKKSNNGGMLSDVEREILADNGIELAPTERESIYTQQFYLYLNLTKPQKKLYITYSRLGTDGKAIRVSTLISKIQALYPKLSITVDTGKKQPLGTDMGLRYFIEGLRDFSYQDMKPQWKEVFCYYYHKKDFKERLAQLIKCAFYSKDSDSISKAAARVLYGEEPEGSISRMERYAACAFAYYLSFGLALEERKEYTISAPELGNVFHSVLENFSRILYERQISFRNITRDQLEEFTDQALIQVKAGYEESVFYDSTRNTYMMKRISRISKRTLWALCEQMSRGEFEAKGFELSFSRLNHLQAAHLILEEGNRMQLRGRIDRIDTFEEEGTVFVKVVDYKSGKTTFDLTDLYYGLQMQLIVYLEASLELERQVNPVKSVVPAGIFYYPIKDPIVDRPKEDSDLAREEAILREMKLNGVVNRDTRVIARLDREIAADDNNLLPEKKSSVLPIETTKTGELKKKNNLIQEENFSQMIHHVRMKLRKYGNEILNGSIDIDPYKKKDKTACEYCAYRGICGFDNRLPGHDYRVLKNLGAEEIWKEMKREYEMDKGSTEGN